jgi:hypothetical protein
VLALSTFSTYSSRPASSSLSSTSSKSSSSSGPKLHATLAGGGLLREGTEFSSSKWKVTFLGDFIFLAEWEEVSNELLDDDFSEDASGRAGELCPSEREEFGGVENLGGGGCCDSEDVSDILGDPAVGGEVRKRLSRSGR